MQTRTLAALCAALLFAGASVRPLAAQAADQRQVLLQAAIHQEIVEGDLERAIRMYRDVVADGTERDVTARALLYLGRSYEKLGSDQALGAYRRVASEYGDQAEYAGAARARLAALAADAPAAEDRGIVIRQVWERQAGALSVSPNGRYLSFVDWTPAFGGDANLLGHADLAVYDTETGRSRLVTRSPSLSENDSYVVDATFSRDGRRLAYSLQSSDGVEWTWQLHVVNDDGTNDRLLVRNGEWRRIETAAWSPDGTFLLIQFRGWDQLNRIATVSVATGEVTVVKTLGRHLAAQPLSLSPDGRYVVYDYLQADGDARHDVFILATDGSSEGRLVTGPADDDRPQWTPDGRRVVFVSDRTGRRSLWAVQVVDGAAVGEPQMVRPDIGTMIPIGFDADGALFYRLSNLVLDVQSAVLDAYGTGLSGEATPVTTRFVGTNTLPAWSPDGDRLAWISYRGAGGQGDPHLVIRALASGEQDEYRFGFKRLRNQVAPRWAADGRSIAVDGLSVPDDVPGTYRLDLATRDWTRDPHVRDVAGRDRHATDRQIQGLRSASVRLLFGFRLADMYEDVEEDLVGVFETGVMRGKPGRNLAQVDVNDPDQTLLTPLFRTLHIHSWALSPDGRRLAIASAEDSTRSDSLVSQVMRIMPVGGGEAVEVFRASGRNEILAAQWMPDGTALLLAVGPAGDSDTSVVWRVPLDGDVPVVTHLRFTARQLRTVDFHPDGRRIVFSTRDGWSEVWAMEGFPWTAASHQ